MRARLYQASDISIAKKAGLTCTASIDNAPFVDTTEFITRLIQRGHESVLEHIVYTFHIEGVTRALLQELARHRLISLSVESTRWALKKARRKGEVSVTLNDVCETYLPIRGRSTEDGRILSKAITISEELEAVCSEMADKGYPNDMVKYFVMEARLTNLFLTVNARELRHICELRSAPCALREFNELMLLLFRCVPKDHKFMYREIFETKEGEEN